MFYQTTLVLNALWFGAAFWYFGIKNQTAAKLLVPKSARHSSIYPTLTSALPFLGGMNFAFGFLAVLLLMNQNHFRETHEQTVLLIVFGVAHASQFLINLPIASRGGRIDESYWDVLKGPMLFIFILDGLMTILNFSCTALLKFQS
ncbi:hypothetical protein HOF92_12110 [bacterium]|jgi:hypothetical protein|nr:hypothetical protein [bacterium]